MKDSKNLMKERTSLIEEMNYISSSEFFVDTGSWIINQPDLLFTKKNLYKEKYNKEGFKEFLKNQ